MIPDNKAFYIRIWQWLKANIVPLHLVALLAAIACFFLFPTFYKDFFYYEGRVNLICYFILLIITIWISYVLLSLFFALRHWFRKIIVLIILIYFNCSALGTTLLILSQIDQTLESCRFHCNPQKPESNVQSDLGG